MRQKILTIAHAADCLRTGEVIAYPTEAVYGLGCDPSNETAVRTILKLKSRSEDNGLILIADRFDRFLPYVEDPGPERMEAALATWPGPVTWLFPRRKDVPGYLAGKHETIALRVSAHPVCRQLCAAFGGAIVSTSANPGGEKPATSPEQLADYFSGSIAGVVEGSLGGSSKPSEIRELSTGKVIRAS